MSNPNLRLSAEVGREDKSRGEQVLGHIPFDWRDWLNHTELRDTVEVTAIALAKSRFDTMRVAPDLMAALIAFKLSVMEARVSHEQAFSRN